MNKLINATGILIIVRIDLILNLINNAKQITQDIKMEALQQTNPYLYWGLQLLLSVIIFFVIYKIFDKIDSLKKLQDNKDKAVLDLINTISTIEKRKMDYLYNCIKSGEILPQNKLGLTDLEKKLLKKIQEERQIEFNELEKQFK